MLLKTKWVIFLIVLSLGKLMAQGEISGIVLDESGEPLAGAHIVVNTTLKSTFSHVDGSYTLAKLPAGNYTLRVSHLGFEDFEQEVKLASATQTVDVVMNPSPFLTDEFVVEATRVSRNAPVTFKNVEKKEIEDLNLGQDLPVLLGWTPSLVSFTDAGAGVGYTGLRIRGNDQTRINVTLNGIPINDAESQGVFWVNMPDLATSVGGVQIQRGLGTSTNGSGAFGASINMETNVVDDKPSALISNSFGSFNTHKHTAQFNSGRMENGFAVEGRISAIQSDGYIDRASSDLTSYFLSGGYYGEKTVVKFITFGGEQTTYQSWNGAPEARMNNDVQGMNDYADREWLSDEGRENLLNSGRTYNAYTYENEVDHYNQDHYQLHFVQELSPNTELTLAGHYTHGEGYFEQYKADDDYADYGFDNPIIGMDTIESTDFIRRRWLDNDFYGGTFALKHVDGKSKFTLGGAAHIYRGDHFGEVIWADIAQGINYEDKYYDNYGNKDDLNAFIKYEFEWKKWNFMTDAQVRYVKYETKGIDSDLEAIDIEEDYVFFNPKVGARYNLDKQSSVYGYVGLSSKEPVRNDFVDAIDGETPEAEELLNIEAGYSFQGTNLSFNANGYYMGYSNQLVPTGELNDVGSAIRKNVGESYRAGIELDATYAFTSKISWNVNATFSQNKIKSFTEYYDTGADAIVNEYKDTDISYSPDMIAASRIRWTPIKNLELNLISKFVGDQFLDNTGSECKSLDAYFVNDFRVSYAIDDLVFDRIEINLLINNIFDEMYSSNGYTYSYFDEWGSQEVVTENLFFPQAGTNFLLGLNLHF